MHHGHPGWDVKLVMGGPVRHDSPPRGWSHLANVRQEAPHRFSGYCSDAPSLLTPTLQATESALCGGRISASNRQLGLKSDSCG